MVVSLSELLSNEKELEALITCFKCSRDKDVENFLKKSAIACEKSGEARTFIYFEDKKKRDGKTEIDGFFTLALKAFYIRKEAVDVNIEKGKPFPAYLIGQLARADWSEKGVGERLLRLAVQYIKTAQIYVGGYFAYLDCKENLVSYYEKFGLKYFQDRKKTNDGTALKQMYMLI